MLQYPYRVKAKCEEKIYGHDVSVQIQPLNGFKELPGWTSIYVLHDDARSFEQLRIWSLLKHMPLWFQVYTF